MGWEDGLLAEILPPSVPGRAVRRLLAAWPSGRDAAA